MCSKKKDISSIRFALFAIRIELINYPEELEFFVLIQAKKKQKKKKMRSNALCFNSVLNLRVRISAMGHFEIYGL